MSKLLPTAAIRLLPLLLLAGCSGGVLDPKGTIAAGDNKIMLNSLVIMLALIIPVIVATLVIAWWFRASNSKARYQPRFVYSGSLEILTWGIPVMIIMFLGGLIWVGSNELNPFRPIASEHKPLEVQVVSLDWKWLFIYPDQQVASVNQIIIPAAAPVHFSLTSATVMNSFFVPQLASMIATMPGMVTQLYLDAYEAGDFYGESTQYSGDGFSGMHFTVHAVPSDQFQQWVETTRQSGPTLDRAAFIKLSRESQNVRPFTYRDADPNLFHQIVMHQVPQSGGPAVEGSGLSTSPVGGK
jgi:cytochrome o ubiquinol oxidase subunit 2